MLAPTEKFGDIMVGRVLSNEFNRSAWTAVNPVVPTTIFFFRGMILGMFARSASGLERKRTTSLSDAASSMCDASWMIVSDLCNPSSLSVFPTMGLVLLHTAPEIFTSEGVWEMIDRPNFPVAPTTHKLIAIVIPSAPILIIC